MNAMTVEERTYSDQQGLLFAYLFDGKGGATSLNWQQVQEWNPDQGALWVHLDYSQEHTQTWLNEQSRLDPIIADALQAEDTRPRSAAIRDGLLVTLRGINVNLGAEVDDMVSIRIWLEQDRIITTRRRYLLSEDDIQKSLQIGNGPRTTAEFIVDATYYIVEHIAEVVENIDVQVDDLDEEILSGNFYEARIKYAGLRRQIINLRRYLAPQRDAMNRLYTERVHWLGERERMHLREIDDSVIRYIEDLDAAKDRVTAAHEQVLGSLSELTNKRMYLLSIVAAVFLPLSFVTGLFGANVGGIPGGDNPKAFIFISTVLFLLGLIILLWFKFKNGCDLRRAPCLVFVSLSVPL